MLPVLVTLALVEEADGRLWKAEGLLKEAIEIATSTLGYDSAAQLDATDILARLLRGNTRLVEAETLEQRAAEIRRKSGQATTIPSTPSTPAVSLEQQEKK